MSKPKSDSALQSYIDFLGLPKGSFPAIAEVYAQMNSRIWLLENGYNMGKSDAHLPKSDPEFRVIHKIDGVTRWDELSSCVEFHVKMASRCWIPTQFRLLNDSGDMPRLFTICMHSPDEVKREREYIIDSMKDVRLEEKANPLAREIRKIMQFISSQEINPLKKNNAFVGLTICTHGVPTDGNGETGKQSRRDFLESLVGDVKNLPVRIVFRLTTDTEKVLEFYKAIDEKYDHVDVLDDFWGEAMEIYLHNPWLTYGIGIHRLREAGLGTHMFDLLDEKPFSLEEVREFCVEFFLSKRGLALRNPDVDIKGFFEDLQDIVEQEQLVFNPLKNKLTPWIDVDKLRLIAKRNKSLNKSPFRRSTHDGYESSNRKPSRGNIKHSASVRAPPGAGKNVNGVHYFQTADDRKANYARSVSDDGQNWSKLRKATLGPQDLEETIKRWSREAPGYTKMKPLEDLLVSVPELFPPTNLFVESHEHFFKWKAFSYDAFIGESGDELKALLKRASRKSKLFLHPDKIPTDLTPCQETLFKSMWEILQESEANTFV